MTEFPNMSYCPHKIRFSLSMLAWIRRLSFRGAVVDASSSDVASWNHVDHGGRGQEPAPRLSATGSVGRALAGEFLVWLRRP